eukprot:scaffold3982_cov72-Skeletonema_dohrnii-CCMP3373.AAC.2
MHYVQENLLPAREEFCPSSGNLPPPAPATPSPSAAAAPTSTPSAPTTKPPTPAPTKAPNCDNPGTCQNRLGDQIFAGSVRMGTTEALDDPNSPQSQARDWILEECYATIPIDPCTASQLILNEQRYGLAVMYYGLGGDSWNAGANPGQDAAAGPGQWMSGLNYCEWVRRLRMEVHPSNNWCVMI